MKVSLRLRATVVAAALVVSGAIGAAPGTVYAEAKAAVTVQAEARGTIWDNCTRFNNTYEHGAASGTPATGQAASPFATSCGATRNSAAP